MAKEQSSQFDAEKASLLAKHEQEVSQMKEQTTKLEGLLSKCRETLKFEYNSCYDFYCSIFGHADRMNILISL